MGNVLMRRFGFAMRSQMRLFKSQQKILCQFIQIFPGFKYFPATHFAIEFLKPSHINPSCKQKPLDFLTLVSLRPLSSMQLKRTEGPKQTYENNGKVLFIVLPVEQKGGKLQCREKFCCDFQLSFADWVHRLWESFIQIVIHF